MSRRWCRGLAFWVAAVVATGVGVAPARGSAAAVTAACAGVAGSETEASALAVSCEEPVVVDDSRTEFAQVVAQPDGRLRFEAAVVPQRTRKAGNWADVDLGLTQGPDGLWRPLVSVADVAFSSGGTGPLVTFHRGGRTMTMSWPGGALPTPSVSGDSATYANVLPDVDLVVRATWTGFAHVLTIKTPVAAANPAVREVRFGLGGDAQVQAGPDGRLRAMAGQTILASADPAVMWDSRTDVAAPGSAQPQVSSGRLGSTSTTAGDAARVAPVAVEVSESDLVLRPDVTLLDAPDAVFPLFVDPAWSVYKTKWAYATDNGSSNVDYSVARVGRNVDTGALYRSFFEFPTTANGVSLKGKHVESAYVQMNLDHSWSCDNSVASMYLTPAINATMKASWSSMTLKAFLDDAWGHANEAGGCSSIQPDMKMNFSGAAVTNQVQTAATGKWNTITVGFTARAADGKGESTQDRWKTFHPNGAKLYVDYDTKPGAPNGLQVAGVACVNSEILTVGTVNPALSAVFPDEDAADSLTGTFELIEVPAGGMSAVTDTYPTRKTPPPAKTGITPNARATSAAVSILGNSTYAFRVRSTDKAPYSLTGPWSEWCQFAADTSVPHVEAKVVTLPGGPGMKGRVRFESTATNVTKFKYGWDAPTKEVAAQGTTTKWAEVDMTAPQFGRNVLLVKAVNAALTEGNGSLEFTVARPQPSVARWGLETYPGVDVPAALADRNTAPTNSLLTAENVTWSDDMRMVGGRVATFNGVSSYAEAPGPVVDTSQSYSVSAWVRLSSLPTQNMAIATQAGSCVYGFFFGIVLSGGTPKWNVTMRSSDCGANATWPQLFSPTAITAADLGKWQHVSFSYDSVDQLLTLLVNGSKVATAPWTTAWKATNAFQIGRHKDAVAPNNFFNGSLADVQVFDRVLVSHDFTGQLASDPLSGGFTEPGIMTPTHVGDWTFESAVPCYTSDSMNTCEAPDSTTAWGRWLALTRGSDVGAGHSTSDLGLWLDSAYFPDEGNVESSQEYGRSAIKAGVTPPDSDGRQFTLWQDAPALRTDDSFTMSAWVTLSDLTASHAVVSQRGVNESAGSLKYSSSDGKWQFAVSDEDLNTTIMTSVSSVSAAESGVWTHLAGVYDAGRSQVRLYVNGVLEGAQAVTYTPMPSSGPILVGQMLRHGQLVDQWVGGIDDIAVFQGAMTDSSVFTWYNSQVPATPGTNVLAGGETFTEGQYLRSNAGNYQLLMQSDGNLVLSQAGFPIWDTGTGGNPGAYLRFQEDGNLVLYRNDDTPLWSTGTSNGTAKQLVLRDDGDLVLIDTGGQVVWRR
ncbi:LamG-like jellyroll fold domain-containing protein [Micromonospora sp. NPDC003197]